MATFWSYRPRRLIRQIFLISKFDWMLDVGTFKLEAAFWGCFLSDEFFALVNFVWEAYDFTFSDVFASIVELDLLNCLTEYLVFASTTRQIPLFHVLPLENQPAWATCVAPNATIIAAASTTLRRIDSTPFLRWKTSTITSANHCIGTLCQARESIVW